MADAKIFAGAALRRLRRIQQLSQSAMAAALGISPSYLNLVERNQRPVTAMLMLRLAERFDIDPRTLAATDGGVEPEALRARLADPVFADLGIDRGQIADWLAAAPATAEAFLRLAARSGDSAQPPPSPLETVGRAIQHWHNYFADLDSQAESLADELHQAGVDLYASASERLRLRHRITVRILPVEVMPDRLHRLDLHARQLQVSELLDPASRTFTVATELGRLEARSEIEALIRGAAFEERAAERLFRRHLVACFAAALMMPYGRFLRACETTGYDVELLQRRFGAGFEQVAHRLTSLQRVGARGLPFFMIRVDRAGQISKRYAGASAAPFAQAMASDQSTRCPLWVAYEAFARPGTLVRQLAELEDGGRWFTMARTVTPRGARIGGIQARFVVALGVDAAQGSALAAASGFDLGGAPTPIGLSCPQCTRSACPQRSAPPSGLPFTLNERERGVSPFEFTR